MRRALLLPVVLLAGCGGGSGKPASDASALRVVAAAKRAILGLHSFHIAGTNTENGQIMAIAGDWTAPGRAEATLRRGPAAARLILIPGAVYMRANARFWTTVSRVPPHAVPLVSNRWIALPATDKLKRLLADLDPRTLSHCLAFDAGTLRDEGIQTLDGVRVHELRSLGDRPGSAPGVAYFAARGPALPLRTVQTGAHRPGGPSDPRCQSDRPDRSTASDLRLSRFNAPVHIAAPPNAITLQEIAAKVRGTHAA